MTWKYTVHHGKKYRAKISLNFLETFATNEQVAEQFTQVGFKEVEVYGSDFIRIVEGVWNGSDKTATITDPHILAVEEITEHKASASSRQVFEETTPTQESPRRAFTAEPVPPQPEPCWPFDPNQPYLEEILEEKQEIDK